MTEDKRWKVVDIDGQPTRLRVSGKTMTIRDLVAMLEKDAADRGVHTTPALERARVMLRESVS